jgi:amino-acid N-acetyltransferase
MLIRTAKIKDAEEIIKIVNYYADRGEMLARSLSQVYSGIRDYIIIEENNHIIGCGALHVVWSDIAEVRTLAVVPEKVRQGLGRMIVEQLLKNARELELPQVFTLTYKPEFFEKLGFKRIDKKELPHKIWKDCLNCPKFPDCDEVALIRKVQMIEVKK